MTVLGAANAKLGADPAPHSVSFTLGGETMTVTLPPPGAPYRESVFLVSLPKAGSTLLNKMMSQVASAAGLVSFNAPQELRKLGVKPNDTPDSLNALFLPKGYLYGGFRGLPGGTQLPSWASGRTVVLVRDPRDMLVSLYFSEAYSHSPPGTGSGGALYEHFQKQREKAQAVPVDDYVKSHGAQYARIYGEMHRKIDAVECKIYRYEDIIFQKKKWLVDMAAYLNIPFKERHVEVIAARNDIVPDEEDRTQHVRRVRPGDHQEKLRPDTIAELNETFRTVLDRYGYS